MAYIEKTKKQIIKSKKRVQGYGEVFTPEWIINKMLNQPGVKEACENIFTTFLEPAVGEGAFLVAILHRKLQIVIENYSDTITQFEEYSLFALTTLYGIEIQEDNTKICVLNIYDKYIDTYSKLCRDFNTKMKQNVLDSAKVIIKTNIVQGDFLTRRKLDGKPIVFSDWKMSNNKKKNRLLIIRTEYSLDEIYKEEIKKSGTLMKNKNVLEQIDLFSFFEDDVNLENKGDQNEWIYSTVKITDVYNEEVEMIGKS